MQGMQHYSYMANIYNLRVLDMADRYVGLMKDIAGEDVMERTRRRHVVLCRMIVAYRLMQDGVTISDIGRVLGVDHSTVHHYREQMTNMLGMAYVYRYEAKLWEAFNQAIESA